MCCCTVDRPCCMSLPTSGIVVGLVSAIWSTLKATVFTVMLVIEIKIDDMNKYVYSFYSINIILCVVDFVASIMLIIGTKRNSNSMLLPWLIVNAIVLIKYIFVGIPLCIYLGVVQCPSIVIVSGIGVWMWVAVNALYRSMNYQRLQEKTPNIAINV